MMDYVLKTLNYKFRLIYNGMLMILVHFFFWNLDKVVFCTVFCTTCASAFLQQGQNCENYIEKVIASEYELREVEGEIWGEGLNQIQILCGRANFLNRPVVYCSGGKNFCFWILTALDEDVEKWDKGDVKRLNWCSGLSFIYCQSIQF